MSNEHLRGVILLLRLKLRAAVQGEHAPQTIVQALGIAESTHPDAILLVRGGGFV